MMLGGYSDVAAYMEEEEQPTEDQPVPLPPEYRPKFPSELLSSCTIIVFFWFKYDLDRSITRTPHV